jgi:predicted CXXCH cytochrome family protein
MLITNRIKAAAKPAMISGMVGLALSMSAQITLAGFIGAPSTMQSTGYCTFSKKLQNSVVERRQFLVSLSATLGGAAPASNDVDAMYGNITKASYSDLKGEDDATNIWGFDSKPVNTQPGIDTFSSDCLGCHDGVGAQAITVDLRNNPFGRRHMLTPGSDHPIGMEYDRYAAAGRGFKPLWGDTGKMVFVNGKVGCLTCHDPINPQRGHLVKSDRNSALCLTCHNK